MKIFFMRYLAVFLSLLFLVVLTNGCGGSDAPPPSVRPVVFVHGYSGSASQFESQAQRFMANGYPVAYLDAYENDTSGATTMDTQVLELDAKIDEVLARTGHTKVDLMGHSRGGFLSLSYLADPVRAAKIAHYVNIDSASSPTYSAPTNVPTLAIWGDGWLLGGDPGVGNPCGNRTLTGATDVCIPDQSHIQVCTSAESFAQMFSFLNGRQPTTTSIPTASGSTVKIAGKVNYFPQNVGAPGTLAIYEINSATAQRIGSAVATYTIDATGAWGPLDVKKGANYEFAFAIAAGGNHYFYREPFFADNYFVRLNTSDPTSPTSLGNLMTKTANHTDILISRDKEMWGNQGANNDILFVDGYNVMTEQAATRAKHLSALFLMDWGPSHTTMSIPGVMNSPDRVTDLSTPIQVAAAGGIFHGITFMSGLDLYMYASSTPSRAISVWLYPRGESGKIQVINVPNWASNQVRITVVFRDFAQ